MPYEAPQKAPLVSFLRLTTPVFGDDDPSTQLILTPVKRATRFDEVMARFFEPDGQYRYALYHSSTGETARPRDAVERMCRARVAGAMTAREPAVRSVSNVAVTCHRGDAGVSGMCRADPGPGG